MKKKVPLRVHDVRVEHCTNPWNGRCEGTDIAVYIYYKGGQLPICCACWNEIADADVEWSGDYAL